MPKCSYWLLACFHSFSKCIHSGPIPVCLHFPQFSAPRSHLCDRLGGLAQASDVETRPKPIDAVPRPVPNPRTPPRVAQLLLPELRDGDSPGQGEEVPGSRPEVSRGKLCRSGQREQGQQQVSESKPPCQSEVFKHPQT